MELWRHLVDYFQIFKRRDAESVEGIWGIRKPRMDADLRGFFRTVGAEWSVNCGLMLLGKPQVVEYNQLGVPDDVPSSFNH